MEFLARFEEIEETLFRFDTRIYLSAFDSTRDSHCIGAIVGKNPGSAVPRILSKLAPLDLNGDKMLPTVGNRFIDGYKLANKRIPMNFFVRVWNLFYVCGPDLDSACKTIGELEVSPNCGSEDEGAPIVWFGWGGDDLRLNGFKERFIQKEFPQKFYYDHKQSRICAKFPTLKSTAKHTQGMPAMPVNTYLANIL